MNNYKFIHHKECEFFPCHEMKNLEDFNCMFCYCPLYMMGEECGGNFKYTPHGIKDCSNCTLPHIKDKIRANTCDEIPVGSVINSKSNP